MEENLKITKAINHAFHDAFNEINPDSGMIK